MSKFFRQCLSLLLVFLSCFLSVNNFLLQISDLFGELALDTLQLFFHLFKLLLKVILLPLLLIVHDAEFFETVLVLVLRLFELFMFLLDQKLFICDLLPLLLNLLLHRLAFLLLIVFVLLHVFLQISFHLSDCVNFDFLFV